MLPFSLATERRLTFVVFVLYFYFILFLFCLHFVPSHCCCCQARVWSGSDSANVNSWRLSDRPKRLYDHKSHKKAWRAAQQQQQQQQHNLNNSKAQRERQQQLQRKHCALNERAREADTLSESERESEYKRGVDNFIWFACCCCCCCCFSSHLVLLIIVVVAVVAVVLVEAEGLWVSELSAGSHNGQGCKHVASLVVRMFICLCVCVRACVYFKLKC